MRLARFQIEGREPRFGWVQGDRLGVIEGDPFGTFERTDADIRLEDVHFTAPILPGKIICVGRNYAAHAAEHGAEVPDLPLLFLKPNTSVIAHLAPIHLPPQSQQVEHEAELAVVIGKAGRWIEAGLALEHILGYTIANDVTARDLQRRDNQWTRAKGFDTFCPLGPWIETLFDPSDALITCRVNGEIRQMASTRDMIFSVRQLIAFASSIMTLEPGDVILTGTPSGVGPLHPEDQVEIEIAGLGKLSNPVFAEAPPSRFSIL